MNTRISELLDLSVTIYQLICFPFYGIPRVRRRDHLVFDRAHLAYLNVVEKFNCAYCSYGKGHARRVLQAHPYYNGFVDYGDAQAYRRQLQVLRADLARLDAGAE